MEGNKYFRFSGILLICIALAIIISVAYHNSTARQQPIVFSDRSMLDGLWNYHKNFYLDTKNYRTIDRQRGNATTSEAQSYTMLRAVWWNDKKIFDRSWQWTKDNLQHKEKDDRLFSWFYNQRIDGTYGVNAEIGGNNSASDADTDIALSLIFAYRKWSDRKYLDDARQIINDIWENEVITIKGKHYLLANNIEKQLNKKTVLLNPSYLAPYAYKIFAKYDSKHDWIGLSDNSYEIIRQSSVLPLDKKSSAGLPPDWIVLDKRTGEMSASDDPHLTTDYSYDAMRTPFRLALDYAWFKDQRAKTALEHFKFLGTQWRNNGAIHASYSHDGILLKSDQSPAIYGGSLGYFMLIEPELAKEIYDAKLKVLYTPDTDSWKTELNYYDDNWVWFGIALYKNFAINLDQ